MRSQSPAWIKLVYWAGAAFLLGLALWSFDIASYSYFAADFPTDYKQRWISHGNRFAILALFCFAAFVYLVAKAIRSRKRVPQQ